MDDAHERPTNDGQDLSRDMEHAKPVAKEILVQPDAKSSGDVRPTPHKERDAAMRRQHARDESAASYKGAAPGSPEAPQSAEALAEDMGQGAGLTIPE